ncbi:hypothetical protein FQR65_LT14692 [Abscondita terminalis]|nr:hypothetical protein FQR65_LT14692 [Abscondita terminalis]
MVLSGIVMTRGSDLSDSETIAISTGTKCVSDEYMSLSGTSLNDLHAEIVARRCLLVYLYSQLKLRLKNLTAENDSVFEASVNPGKFKLKQHIQFHLYISSAPCGDARLFTVDNDIEDIDLHPPRRISRGKLRTKTISGQDTTPAKFKVIQTWEGVFQGETLLTMACSDKIMRWNVLGLQGSLLSHFVDPIYLKSIILGCRFKKSDLYRAVRGRIENTVQELPAPYYLNCPQLLYSTPSSTSQLGKELEFSVNWINGCPDVEIINTNTGKPENGFSRLCKRNLMKRFLDICTELRDYSRYSGDLILFYDEVKQLTDYNIAKQQLMKAFPKAGLGTWVHKPIEQQQFALVFK